MKRDPHNTASVLISRKTLKNTYKMKRTFNEAFRILIDRHPRYRKKNGAINNAAIARVLEVTDTTVYRMINKQGYFPDAPLLNKLCTYFNVTLDQIAGNAYFDFEIDEEQPNQKMAIINRQIEFINVFTLEELRNYNDIYEAANNKAHPETFPMIREYANNKKMLLVEVKDESNAPLYKTGDLVLVDLFKSHSIGLKVLATLKTGEFVIRTLGDDETLYAENPIYHPKRAEKIFGVCDKIISIREAQNRP